MKLNLGSGWDNRAGYINVDSAPHHHPDVVADVMNLPFAAGTVTEVLAQDVLEHLPRTSTIDALIEWRRVTEPGGVARIRVPSLFHAVDLMRSADTLATHQLLLQNLYGTQAYSGDVHLTSFTDRTLADALHSAGYRRVSAELVDRWMWDITAWACDAEPLALFWGPGFYPGEGLEPNVDYQEKSAAWRWSSQESSLSLVNTGETRLRVALSFTLRAEHEPDGSIVLGAAGREWRCRVGEAARIELSTKPGQRVEIAFRALVGRLDAADSRELFFQVNQVVLRVEVEQGSREPAFQQASSEEQSVTPAGSGQSPAHAQLWSRWIGTSANRSERRAARPKPGT